MIHYSILDFRFWILPQGIGNRGEKGFSQSPVTNHQSPITSHQSPVTNHQSPITSHLFPHNNPNRIKPRS
ncbi:hypothetical protein [Sphaerospermopsis sp. FACHB-1094]|uniref:hypothetical protein n=1 Tax=Sphaerospermopsis sp. FACHB-1094 TaxID=2692861 RepID=UPI0016892356|nr:hypothetical protein [Sphaerospermopsis sp. FACHB-1094]